MMVNRMPPVTLLVATPFPRLPPRSLITPQALTAPGQPSSLPFSIKRFANVGCDNLVKIWGYREDSQSWVKEETLEESGATGKIRDPGSRKRHSKDTPTGSVMLHGPQISGPLIAISPLRRRIGQS